MQKLRPPRKTAPPPSVEMILAWADAHRQRTRECPGIYSGLVAGALYETWRRIDNALRYGLRGLPGRSSLAQLLAERRGVRNHMGLRRLTTALVLRWADAFHRRTDA
jgi:hypothetical protein